MGVPHDKIIKKQKMLSEPYKNKDPTKVIEIYHIYAQNKFIKYPSSTERSGKWLIFVPKNQINQVWRKIKKSVEIGELGRRAKVSTSRPSPNAQDPNKHVICVYTYDSEDVEDVMRIRQRLRELGITNKIPYKTDRATMNGKYAIRGHKKISKYVE